MEQKLKTQILNKNLALIKTSFIQKHKKMIDLAITSLLLIPLAVIALHIAPQFKHINESAVAQSQQEVVDLTELKLSFNNFDVKDINKMLSLIQEDEDSFKLYQQAKYDFNDKQDKADIATFVELTTLFSPHSQPEDINKVNSGLVIIDQYISAMGIYMYENQFKLTDKEKEHCNAIMDNLVETKNTGLQQLDKLSTPVEKTQHSQKM